MTVGKSGEFTITCGGTAGLYLTVCWSEGMDTDSNASILSVTQLRVNGTGRMARCYINGTIGVNGSVIARLGDNAHWAELTVDSDGDMEQNGAYPFASAPITHAADGTGSAVLSVQLSGSIDELGQHYYASAEQSVVLTDFSRVSAVTAVPVEIGAPMTIGITSPSADFLHTLRYVCGETTGIIGSGLSGGSHTWATPMELCAAMPDSVSGECTVFCDTYRGGTMTGTSEYTVTLRVPIGVGLTLGEGWLTLRPDNSGTIAEGLDCYVQGRSRVQAVIDEGLISGESAYGAALASCSVTVGGVIVGESYLSQVLHTAGEVSVGCTVTDTRGRRQRVVWPIEVLPYAAPVIGTASVFRCTEDGGASDGGTCVSATAGCRYSPLGGRNAVELTARLRSVDGEWGEAVSLTEGETAVLWAGMVSAEQTYEAELRAVDSLGSSALLYFTLPTDKVFFHGRAGGSGGAFGKYAEEDDLLEVAWSLKTKGDLTVEGTAVIGGKALTDWLYPVGTVCTCSADTDPAALYGGVWTAAEDTVQRWVRTE